MEAMVVWLWSVVVRVYNVFRTWAEGEGWYDRILEIFYTRWNGFQRFLNEWYMRIEGTTGVVRDLVWQVCVTWYGLLYLMLVDNADRYASLMQMFWVTLWQTTKTLYDSIWEICVVRYNNLRWLIVTNLANVEWLIKGITDKIYGDTTTLWGRCYWLCMYWYTNLGKVVGEYWARFLTLVGWFVGVMGETGKTFWDSVWELCVTRYMAIRFLAVNKYAQLIALCDTNFDRIFAFMADPVGFIWTYILTGAENTVKTYRAQFQLTCEHCLRYLWEGVW